MPRFMVERAFGNITDQEMLEAAIRSDRTIAERYPDITWEHSHVCVDTDGAIITYCVYDAPDEQMIHDHAAALGGHSITKISEIAEDVDPAEVRRRAEAR